jgi:hypothetical protein
MTGRQGWDRILGDLHAGREIPSQLPKRNGFVYGDQDELLNQPYHGYSGQAGGGGIEGGMEGGVEPVSQKIGQGNNSNGGVPNWVSGRPDVYFEGEMLDPSRSFNDQMAERSPRIAEIWNQLKANNQRTEPKQPMSSDVKGLLDKMGVNY